VSEARYQTGADLMAGWRDDLLSGRPPRLYRAGVGELAQVEIGPGLVTLLGGAPGAGKTALAMQLLLDGLRLNESLRAAVCNVEMSPAVLLDRQLARLSGIDLGEIRYRKLTDRHSERIDLGMRTLGAVADRLAFVRPPFDLNNVAASADAFGADLLLLDYIQRIPPPREKADDRRGSVDATMNYLRQFADAGVAVVVVAAVARSRDRKGRSSYAEGLNLASFRESSELEFGADDAFMLLPDGDGAAVLKHLKSRHGEPKDIALGFDGRLQRFTAAGAGPKPDGQLRAKLRRLWQVRAESGDGDENGDEE
jgi:replicative DNA helicase